MSETKDLFSLSNGQVDPSEIQLPKSIQDEIDSGPGEIVLPNDGRVGVTMFDATGSKDNLLTVVVPKKNLAKLPSQALVRICSPKPEDGGDGRIYQGIVVQGPFYEPDGLSANSSIILTTAANEVMFLPKYHGRVMVEIIGEVVEDALVPQRFRPLPNSPVYPLSPAETEAVLNVTGEMVFGCAIGHEQMEIKIPALGKAVLPRHLGILGTTGGGKSTTVSGLVSRFQEQGIATILVDTEGEYTHVNQKTEDGNMLKALKRRGLEPKGVSNTHIWHLVGRDTSNPIHPDRKQFTLHFDQISPYSVMEILDFTPAQQERYLKAYDIARVVMKRFGIFPEKDNKEQEDMLHELDEMVSSYPKLTLEIMYDIVSLCGKKIEKTLPTDTKDLQYPLRSSKLKERGNEFLEIINTHNDLPGNVYSWRATQGLLSRLLRLKIFDNFVVRQKVMPHNAP